MILYSPDYIRGYFERRKNRKQAEAFFQGEFINKITGGACLGKLFIRSAGTGAGKTRTMVGDFCEITFNQKKKTLYVIAEQDIDDLIDMIFCWKHAEEDDKELLNELAETLAVVKETDPTCGMFVNEISKIVVDKEIKFVFFDYIFTNPSLRKEMGANTPQNVQLKDFAKTLKDFAVKYDVFVETSTQITQGETKVGEFMDSNRLRDSKGIADVCDIGCVMTRISTTDFEKIIKSPPSLPVKPNIITDFYKVRNKRDKLRVWSYFDHSCLEIIDLMITDQDNNVIEVIR